MRKTTLALSFLLMGVTLTGATSRPDGRNSDLRKAVGQLYATKRANFLVVTDAVLKFVPLGMPEAQAARTISAAGLRQRSTDTETPTDPRCSVARNAGIHGPCDRANKSDYYVGFAGTERWLWPPGSYTSYWIQIGIRTGAVDFVYANVRTECFCP